MPARRLRWVYRFLAQSVNDSFRIVLYRIGLFLNSDCKTKRQQDD
jgi:hypothetical protein